MNPAAGDFRLHLASPCINRGNISHYNNGLGFDLLGAARVQGAGLDLGAYESGIGGARIAASVEGGGTLEPLGVTLYPDLPAQAVFTATPWPGRTLTHFSTNGVALPVGGNTLLLDLTTDQALNLTAHFAGTLYADAARPDDSGDGLSWATAKRTLQGAVAAAVDNDTVLAAPGLYQEGAAVTPNEKTAGYLLNRVVITNQITLRSRDGNAATVIQGAFDSGSGDLYGRGRRSRGDRARLASGAGCRARCRRRDGVRSHTVCDPRRSGRACRRQRRLSEWCCGAGGRSERDHDERALVHSLRTQRHAARRGHRQRHAHAL